MAMNSIRNTVFTECDISRRSLNRIHLTLVKNINEHDIGMILREVERTELLSLAEIKDTFFFSFLGFRLQMLLFFSIWNKSRMEYFIDYWQVFLKMMKFSDDFSFQNNGIKKKNMLENNRFFWKTMGFFFIKRQCFWHDFTHDFFLL